MPHYADSSSPESSPEMLRETLQDYALLTMDSDGTILQWSEGAERVFGYKESEVIGRSFALLFTAEDLETNRPAAELGTAASKGMSEDERWHVRKDGSRIWVTGTVRGLRNEQGELTGFSKLARDITTQKLAALQRDALLERERRAREEAERKWKNLEEISENVPAFIALVKLPEQEYVFANRIYRESVGQRKLIGRTVRDAHPEVVPEMMDILSKVASTGEVYKGTEQLIGEQYFDLILQPMRSEAAQSEAILIFAVNVTERVRSRRSSEVLTAELKEEGERLKQEIAERKRAERLAEQRAELVLEQAAMINLAHDAIMAVRLDGTVELWNCGAEETYGWKQHEAVGKEVHALLQTKFLWPLEKIQATLLAEGQWNGELQQARRDGKAIEVSSRWVLWKREGKPHGWLEINRDITERKRMEAHVRETQKMESLGVLAGGIAHDFNNLLTGVMGNVSLALDMVEPGSSIKTVLTYSLQASEQAAFLTKQILAYAGKGQFIVQPANLSTVARETLSLIGSLIPNQVHVKLELSDDLPPVLADVSQLQQVAMNLIFNAVEAIGERGGQVVIRTGIEDVAEAGEGAPYDIGPPAPGRCVVLEVKDDGSGIEPSVRLNMFDPFFTTKFTGRGLGLAAISGIVRSLNGAVRVDSTPGRGTTFRVLLPAGLRPAAKGLAAGQPVLVVDDEEIVRRTAEAMLRSRGYGVLLAEGGQQGLELFRQAEGRVALVLLDMTMPGLSSEETFRELKSTRPDLPVIVSSGFSEQEAMRRFGGMGVAGYIQKPYTTQALMDKITAVLNR